VLFLKPNTAVIGPNDGITYPSMSGEVHYEGELAVVIGRICKDVPPDRTAEVVFGYTCGNDVTARDLQRRDGQWSRAKGFDTFAPLGPWIETDFDPADRELSTTLNGERKQFGRTKDMTFGVAALVSYISSAFTLLPGDVILRRSDAARRRGLSHSRGHRHSHQPGGIPWLTCRSASGSRRRPVVTCTSAISVPRSTPGRTPGTPRARSCSGSRTPTAPGSPTSTSTPRSSRCAGSAWTGTRVPRSAARTGHICRASGWTGTGSGPRASSSRETRTTATARRRSWRSGARRLGRPGGRRGTTGAAVT
jgi:hypothetical protein